MTYMHADQHMKQLWCGTASLLVLIMIPVRGCGCSSHDRPQQQGVNSLLLWLCSCTINLNIFSNQTQFFPVFKKQLKVYENFGNVLDFIYFLLRHGDFGWHMIIWGGCICFPKIITIFAYLNSFKISF